MANAFLNTVFAQMLRGREIDRQRKIDEKVQQDEQRRVVMRQMLEEQRLIEGAKQQEFDRHRRVAEMEARAAALRGEGSAPSGYFNPAVQEMANAAYSMGGVEREGVLAERGQKQAELSQQQNEEYGRNWREASTRMGSTINSRYVKKSPEAYAAFEQRTGFPQGSLSEVPYSERFAPGDGGGDDRISHFTKMEQYLNQAANEKGQWAAFLQSGQLRSISFELRDLASRGLTLPEALEELQRRNPNRGPVLQHVYGVMTNQANPVFEHDANMPPKRRTILDD